MILIKKFATKPDSYKMISIDSTGKVLSSTSSENSVYVDASKGQLIRIQKRDIGKGAILIDSTIADLGTLAPIRMSMTTKPNSMSMNLTFDKDKVVAKANMNGQMTDAIHEMKEPYFDSNLLDLLIGLLPYKKGYSTTITTYTFERKGGDAYSVEYVGDDVMFNGSTPVVCSMAEVMPVAMKGKGFPGYRYWVEKKTGIIVKMLISGPNKSPLDNGIRMVQLRKVI